MRDPRQLIERAGVFGDPAQDQHFLIDDRVLDRLPSYAQDAGFDCSHVLEIGPGPGSLTDRLLAVAPHVTAIERDRRLVAFLEQEFASALQSNRLALCQGDAVECELPDYSCCISNLPYGVSSPVLFRLLPRDRPLVVMVQREFGERMAAEPGSSAYGRLSVSAQHYALVELVEDVPPSAFSPQPRVDSVVVRTTPRAPTYEVPSDDHFLAVVKAIFTQRRKTLRNAIRNTTHISGIADAEAVCDELSEELLGTRPEEIPPETFAMISRLADRRDE